MKIIFIVMIFLFIKTTLSKWRDSYPYSFENNIFLQETSWKKIFEFIDPRDTRIAFLPFLLLTQPLWQKWIFKMIGITGIVIFVGLIMKRRIRTIRSKADLKRKILETEMAALRAQMNPHFIFNSINAIDGLIQDDEKDKATEYLSKFPKLIRNVLESSKNDVIPFQKDLETVKLFIALEQFRFNFNFETYLNVDQRLMEGDYMVPPMLIQPFIENAIQHGLFNKEKGDKHIKIDVKLEERFIIYTITDNGIGREKAKELKRINKPDHISYGIEMSKDRLKIYNQGPYKYKEGNPQINELSIVDLYENGHPSGTKVQLLLKLGFCSKLANSHENNPGR